MICKWCGETVKPGAGTCKRCKRQIPALSDCGGFYDLVNQSSPILPPVAETPPAPQPPVRPAMPQQQKKSILPNLLLCLALILAVIFLLRSVSLSKQLTQANEEMARLRNHLRYQDDTVQTAPTLDNSGEETPSEPTEPEEILLTLQEGVAELDLSKKENLKLNTKGLRFTLFQPQADAPVLIFTLQLQSDGEELYLQIIDADGITIHTVQWYNSSMEELPPDGGEGMSFGQIFTSPNSITDYTQSVAELGEGESTCTLTGENEAGEELTITIRNIDIE
jgi:hypothetical protein